MLACFPLPSLELCPGQLYPLAPPIIPILTLPGIFPLQPFASLPAILPPTISRRFSHQENNRFPLKVPPNSFLDAAPAYGRPEAYPKGKHKRRRKQNAETKNF